VYEQIIKGITPSSDLKNEVSDVFVVSVCRSMGWTYQQYCEAPQWFIDTLEGMMSAEKSLKAEQTR
jgi:hypothetical protein